MKKRKDITFHFETTEWSDWSCCKWSQQDLLKVFDMLGIEVFSSQNNGNDYCLFKEDCRLAIKELERAGTQKMNGFCVKDMLSFLRDLCTNSAEGTKWIKVSWF